MNELEELAHELEFGDRSKGVDVDAILAAAAACRELGAWRDHAREMGQRGVVYTVPAMKFMVTTDAALAAWRGAR